MISLETTRTNNNKTRGRTLVGLTQLGLVRKGSIVDQCQNVPNATTIIMVRVYRSVTSATRLATWPGIAVVLAMIILIDLMSGAAPVARAPNRLAPSEMKELSDQLQELSDKGFIRPKLNKITVKNRYPLLRIDDLFDQLQGSSVGTDNQEKDEKQSQNDKTGLGMEKTVKDKAKSKPESQSSQKVNRKVNWSKSKSTQVNPEMRVHAGCQDSEGSRRIVLSFLEFDWLVGHQRSIEEQAIYLQSTSRSKHMTYGTISSERSWEIEWLISTSWKRIFNLQTFLTKLAKRTVRISSSMHRHEEFDHFEISSFHEGRG
ncbi:hypothetical protein Tco_1253374 [Tanacetum coccineum]